MSYCYICEYNNCDSIYDGFCIDCIDGYNYVYYDEWFNEYFDVNFDEFNNDE